MTDMVRTIKDSQRMLLATQSIPKMYVNFHLALQQELALMYGEHNHTAMWISLISLALLAAVFSHPSSLKLVLLQSRKNVRFSVKNYLG